MSGVTLPSLRTIAAKQHGAVTMRQLKSLGFTESAIRHQLARGNLRRVHRGVYSVGLVEPTQLGRFAAAILACGRGAVLSHLSAAILWNLLEVGLGAIDVTVPGRRARSREGIRVHNSSVLVSRDRRTRAGLPVTSPSMTILDLVASGTDVADAAWNEALLNRLTSESEMRSLLDRVPLHRGAAGMRRLLEASSGSFSRSRGERALTALIGDAGLPKPDRNGRVLGYELDYFWPELRLSIEMDGYRWHSTRARLNSDRNRDADLTAQGVQVLRISYDQLEEPMRVVALIAAAIALARRRT